MLVTTVNGDRRAYVLKHARLDRDWTALRTGDFHGREALLLSERALDPLWEVFACPYRAFAMEPSEVGLLLDDLTDALLPDVRAPLTGVQENALLEALARLHARFWDARRPDLDWLAHPAHYCEVVGPAVADDPTALAVFAPPLRDAISRGWALALSAVPRDVGRLLHRPGIEWEKAWTDVPWTLIHGDAKVANFARLPDHRVAAFDWAMVGIGPCTIDLGWYVAVNASRLTEPKEEIMRRYRALLEQALGRALPDSLWRRLERIAIVAGARMLLWSKAVARDAGRPGASEEWSWWIDRLAFDGGHGAAH